MMDLTSKILSDYSYYLKIERAMSPNTVTSYSTDIREFFDATTALPAEVTTQDIIDYLAAKDKLSKRSQARLLSSLRSFFDWLVAEGERKDNPCETVDSPKLGRYLPEVLSVDEVTSIMESVDLSSWNGKRDRAILEVLYGCGLRVSEAVNLKISHVYLEPFVTRLRLAAGPAGGGVAVDGVSLAAAVGGRQFHGRAVQTVHDARRGKDGLIRQFWHIQITLRKFQRLRMEQITKTVN